MASWSTACWWGRSCRTRSHGATRPRAATSRSRLMSPRPARGYQSGGWAKPRNSRRWPAFCVRIMPDSRPERRSTWMVAPARWSDPVWGFRMSLIPRSANSCLLSRLHHDPVLLDDAPDVFLRRRPIQDIHPERQGGFPKIRFHITPDLVRQRGCGDDRKIEVGVAPCGAFRTRTEGPDFVIRHMLAQDGLDDGQIARRNIKHSGPQEPPALRPHHCRSRR